MACVVCLVLCLGPRDRNVRGNPVAYPQNVLFTAGRRVFLSRSSRVGGGAMVKSRPRRGSISWVLGRPVAQRGDNFGRLGGFAEARRGWWRCCRSYDLLNMLFLFLPSSAPIVAYGCGGGR